MVSIGGSPGGTSAIIRALSNHRLSKIRGRYRTRGEMNDDLDSKIAAAIAAASQPIPAAHRNRSKSRSRSKSGVSSSPKSESEPGASMLMPEEEKIAQSTTSESTTVVSEGFLFKPIELISLFI